MEKKFKFPKEDIRALVAPESINAEKRTVDVTFSTGARVPRWNWMIGEYQEELSMKPSHVRLDRFKNGAPVLKDHRATLENMIGVIEKASVRNGEGTATVRFSEREDADAVFKDVQGGIIRNISIGYVKHKIEKLKKQNPDDEKEVPVYRVIDWEPFELSFLPVGADAGATVRNMDQELFSCEIENLTVEGSEMAQENEGKRNQPEDEGAVSAKTENQENEVRTMENKPKVDEAKIREDAAAAERKRAEDIRAAVKLAKLEGELADDMVSRGITVDKAREEILSKLAEKDKESETRSANVSAGEDQTFIGMKRGIEQALLHRLDAKNEIKEEGQKFRNYRLLDMVGALLGHRGLSGWRELSPMQIASRGLHSTSDFPEILANVANKSMLQAYSESPQTFIPFTRKVTVSDFKEISRLQLGDVSLREKKESGEYEFTSLSEYAEKYSVKTYGRVIGFSREALVNDDLQAFGDMPMKFGRAAANLESDIIWAIITANQVMADGTALFHADHGNLAAAGAAPSVTTLGAAREAMRLQTGLDGNKLNIRPSWLVVPAALETVADQLTTSINPDQSGNVNPFVSLNRVAEPRLDDASSTEWYVFATAAEIAMFEMAYLTGETSPVLDSMVDFDTDGLKWKARHTVGARAMDWRGFYKNPGA